MPRSLRRRGTLEAELDTAATDAAEIGDGPPVSERMVNGIDNGLDGGLTVPSHGLTPTNGNVPHSTFPRTPSPSPDPGRGGYIPLSSTPTHGGIHGRKPLDKNTYATKKTVAQGMMDLALLTANANQLRYVIEAGESGHDSINYYVSITLISLSIISQLVIGIALIFLTRISISNDPVKADRLNDWIVLGVFIITIFNVFISSFAIEPRSFSMLPSGQGTDHITGK